MRFLETERLALRQLRDGDLDEIVDYRNDPRCAKYQRWEKTDRDSLAEWIQLRRDDVFGQEGRSQFAIVLKESDEIIGELSVFLEDPTITLGYAITYKRHRRGYGFEILSAVIDALHGRYPDREVICLVEPENQASIGLLKKLEFQDLGYAPKITSQVFGKWPVEE